MKERGKNELFLQYSKMVLQSVKILKLSWCKVLPYCGGKFGGWVSENYLGLLISIAGFIQ